MILVFIESFLQRKAASHSNTSISYLRSKEHGSGHIRFILVVEFENQLAESGNDPRFHLMPAQLGKSLAGMKRLLLGNTDFPSGMPVVAQRQISKWNLSLATAAVCQFAQIRDFPSGDPLLLGLSMTMAACRVEENEPDAG
jgi:hypothetical protein